MIMVYVKSVEVSRIKDIMVRKDIIAGGLPTSSSCIKELQDIVLRIK